MLRKHIALQGLTVALVMIASQYAVAQFTDTDWARHRATNTRAGHNADPGLDHTLNRQLGPVWVWPPSRDMPAEIVVDNTTLPPGPATVTGQSFEVSGSWVWPASSNRAPGAWPPSDQNTDKLGDYVYKLAEANATLRALDVEDLKALPNTPATPLPDIANPGQNTTLYGIVERELRNSASYARWSFGTRYPLHTYQGTVDISTDPLRATPLAAGVRYAVYIRFPASGTLIEQDGAPRAHPNADHVFVRVSWGADVNDPVTSRVFMLDFGQTGGFWMRVRSGAGDDRYFPYDGTNPIRVTLYGIVPDDVDNAALYPYKPIVAADAVRLVPESMRGDIHAPAVSAIFPPGADPNAPHSQLTYFGRDETTGPQILFPNTVKYTSPIGFTGIPLDPTKPPSTTLPASNPVVADPTSSIRSAVFYCIEDRVNPTAPSNGTYGRLRWRYPTRSVPIVPVTIDDVDGPGTGFTTESPLPVPPPWNIEADPLHQPYGTQYRWTPVSATNTLEAHWASDVAIKGPTPQTFSVFVYIPAGSGTTNFARYARYRLPTEDGYVDVVLDQRNTPDGVPVTGMWRLLASGIRFKQNNDGTSQRCEVVLFNESPRDASEDAGRVIVADAVRFVPESQTPNSVVASPLLARVRWPSGTVRDVVYFGTTDGHLWALDAIGADPVADAPRSTMTTAYWVYPSISNPDPAGDLNNNGVFDFPQDDPNYFADPENNRTGQGIDGDIKPARGSAGGDGPYVAINKVPDLGSFVSSPIYVEVEEGVAPNIVRRPYIVVGNQNGRLYAFDPAGRTTNAGEPFPATVAVQAGVPGAPDEPGIPGTTRRLMTWPTLARDKWLSKGGSLLPDGSFAGYSDDPAKVVFAASPIAPKLDAGFRTDRVIAGAGDGHVYCVDMQTLDRRTRISNPANDGAAIWQWPEKTTQLAPIVHPGVLTDTGKYVFSAGGRVYCIRAPQNASGQPKDAGGFLQPEWTYPYANSPANPNKSNDAQAEETDFTAPAWVASVANNAGVQLNGGNEVVFVANRDGRVFALDASRTGNDPGQLGLLWEAWSRGPTRASAVFLQHLPPQTWYQDAFTANQFPGVLLPLDTGAIIGISALTQGRLRGGDLMWSFADAQIGRVPLSGMGATGPLPIPLIYPTSSAFRGADAITANNWVFSGDEGNQNTGEVHGQMRAYWRAKTAADPAGLGMVTPDEPDYDEEPDETSMAMKLVDLWYGRGDTPPNKLPITYERFGKTMPDGDDDPTNDALSPLTAWNANQEAIPTITNPDRLVVYEWGDTIYVAAWGTVTSTSLNPPLPTVTFRLFGAGQSRPPLTVGAVRDYAAPVPPLPSSPPYPPGSQFYPWVAKVAFPLGRGSEADAQTPGRRYTVLAQAQLATADGVLVSSLQLAAGQALIEKNDADPYGVDDALATTLKVSSRKELAIAHPLALSTRAVPGGSTVGPNAANVIGWVSAVATTAAAQEVLANGNARYNPPAGRPPLKDLVAPVGFVGHGASASYLGVDAAGRRVDALLIADRSNMHKLNQQLNNVRVERRDLRWGWDPGSTDPFVQATGNVMNPLPWETFPNTVPNTSPDYPDLDRSNAKLRLSGIDMSARAVTLPNKAAGGALRYVPIELTVSVPRYQPANVNRTYLDINRNPFNPSGAVPGLLAPMLVQQGRPAQSKAEVPGGAIAPSAGYYGDVVVYVDNNGDGRYQGSALQSRATQAVANAREEVYRQFATGVAVPPDLSLRAEEETIDLGKVPHSAGYVPGVPFAPSGIGPYLNTPSPFDPSGSQGLFAPFTVRNTGNVNLVNLRVAKLAGDAPDAWAYPGSWARLGSDQVSPFLPVYDSQGALVTGTAGGRPFDLPLAWYLNSPLTGRALPIPFAPNLPPGANYGIVSSLDHANSAGLAIDALNLWPYNLNAVPGFSPLRPDVEPGNPYVRAGNPLGWPAGVNPQPTLHKPRPGDSGPTVLSIPDVGHGDPFGVLVALRRTGREVRPKIGIAPPLGTPAGTYSSPVYVFEDAYPPQWREWLSLYDGANNPLAAAVTDNGMPDFRAYVDPADRLRSMSAPVEPIVQNPFRLKIQIREARLTNAQTFQPAPGAPLMQTDGTFPQVDVRTSTPNNPDAAPFGANVMPTMIFDWTGAGTSVNTGLLLAFASNRPEGFGPAPAKPDVPWRLLYTQLRGGSIPFDPAGSFGGTAPALFGWRFDVLAANPDRWWSPTGIGTPFPALGATQALFPSQQSDSPGPAATPVVPGVPAVNGNGDPLVVHGSPALVRDEASSGRTPDLWLFWQGGVNKNTADGGSALDARTFYVPIIREGSGAYVPDVGSAPGGLPYGFLNDPSLPKYAPKPLVVDGTGYLFWHGGPASRTRLFYNVNAYHPTRNPQGMRNPEGWSIDRALPTPGGLYGLANPVPIPKRLDPDQRAANTVTHVDLVYTGQFQERAQPETFMTRYLLRELANGRPNRAVTPFPRVENELLARQGASQTWAARDVAWVYRDPNTSAFVDGTGNSPWIVIRVNGARVNLGEPVFDSPTGKLYFNSTLGGRLVVDPQAGTVTFPDIAPRISDAVTVSYTPQTLRLNVTRSDTGVVSVPAGWQNDAGFAPQPAVPASGANTGAVAVLDRSDNPRRITEPDSVRPGAQAIRPTSVSRLWLFYRKTGSNVTSSGGLYFKTMRLMVRLPRPVPRNADGTIGNNIQISGNRGPVEIDWQRGRLYFTEIDEGATVRVSQAIAGGGSVEADYRVSWGDEMTVASTPGDQTTGEAALPTEASVNEGQLAVVKDPFVDRMWLVWASTRSGTTDLYYMAVSPSFYPQTYP
ncbi:MAG: hypothetical protein GX446_10840 [Chthonomonadales bacterium]|nr:hypothetical protein [Chthonomonadales bacterium]